MIVSSWLLQTSDLSVRRADEIAMRSPRPLRSPVDVEEPGAPRIEGHVDAQPEAGPLARLLRDHRKRRLVIRRIMSAFSNIPVTRGEIGAR
jgi:hypothetical protein